MDESWKQSGECSYKEGALCPCAPLAVSYVPKQGCNPPLYEKDKALARGTLFPGLDLPLGNIVNTGFADVPLAELMSIDFAAHDLQLYLDTHPDDQEAFTLYRELLELARAGQEKYAKLYGPISLTDLRESNSYTWLKAPWPWHSGNAEG